MNRINMDAFGGVINLPECLSGNNKITTDMNPFRSNINLLLCLIMVFPLWVLPLHAQVYPEDYLDEALQNNPGLRAMQLAYDASVQREDVVSALPDPVLSGGVFTPPMKRLMGNQWVEAGVMQMFPWFGTLQKQGEAAGKMAEGAYHQYRESRNQLFFELTRKWLGIYKLDRQQRILARFIEVLKEREDLVYIRYEGGSQRTGLPLDIYRLQIELSDLENRMAKLDEERISLIKSFNILAGREELAGVDIPSSLPGPGAVQMDVVEKEKSFEGNPLLHLAKARADEADIQKEVARLKTRPMLGLGVQYAYFEPGSAAMGQMSGGHMLMPMVSVSVPVFRKKNEASRRQSQLLAESARLLETNQSEALETQWVQLEAGLQNLRRDHNFYQRQRDIILKAWDLVLAAYAGGDEGFDDLLRIQDQLLDLEWRLLETNVNHHLKRAEMDMLQAINIFE